MNWPRTDTPTCRLDLSWALTWIKHFVVETHTSVFPKELLKSAKSGKMKLHPDSFVRLCKGEK